MRTCAGAPLAAAAVVRQRADYTVTPRAPCLCPNPEEKNLPSEIEPPHAISATSRFRKQSAAPLGGARDRPLCPSPGRAWRTPGGSGRLESRRGGIGGKTSWAAGFEYHHHHQQQQRHKRQLNATSLSIYTTHAGCRPCASSLARSRAGSRAAAQPACRAMPTRTHRGR
jgi:hypothetical protein